ncbi:response regulator receiver protein [Alkalidesulfovibrio alkalitolerans DSM 16529]|uniref:Response regulator receiver protein n=1 Tax=Alkalidesulfovibrio alkalitolerans DSM 16529 TaxID=1121439 RepID=S7T7L8_9BACT|nr:response regulator [Alkalidesulfovibrio alkalitolerans]EPR33117.1 response regulator receiver protein [Alkalidesulfovibrio alkalitolerans DSM 16529]
MSVKILLVDDEQGFVETMEKRLTKRGIEVKTALSGQAALEALAEGGVEVVVLDVKMPVMDGIETLRRIKAEYPLTEVIMLTGHGTVETAIEGMKLGAYDYMLKPCELEELMDKAKLAAGRRREHEQRIVEARAQSIALRRGD